MADSLSGSPSRSPYPVTGDSGFTVLAAAELYGDKVNIELEFNARPGLGELSDLIHGSFSLEHAVNRPDGLPATPFAIDKLTLYDEISQRWVDLTDAMQLSHWCQVYALQRPSAYHRETQQPLPPPQKPMRAALPDTASPTEKAKAVFDELDLNGDRVLELEELRRGLRTLSVDFDVSTTEEVFAQADRDQDGVVSSEEWLQFATSYSTLINCLYYRSRNYWEDFRQQQDVKSLSTLVEGVSEQRRQADLLLKEAQRDVDAHEEQLRDRRRRQQEHADRARRAEAALDEARGLCKRAEEDCGKARAEVQHARELEAQQALLRQESQARAAEADRRVREDEAELSAAEQRCRQLQAELSQAQHDAAARKQAAEASRKRAAGLQQKSQSSEQQLQRAKQDAQARQRREAQAVDSLRELEQRARDYNALHADALATEHQHTHAVTHSERELSVVRERAAGRRRDAEVVRAEEDRARSQLSAQEEAIAEQRKRRREVERQEQPLLDDEVALARQRLSISRREQELRTAAAAPPRQRPASARRDLSPSRAASR
eukprot:TRINITY_DN4585_c5_g1_i1.p1 TRINITY_DN4585_c5_g1~~TRINITY_DN4585_c5_g1_i1.p1  ORF type:complete len:548 (+),score=239.28 TRINITY_DN4585_c5_g1_i1:111-1754(+)